MSAGMGSTSLHPDVTESPCTETRMGLMAILSIPAPCLVDTKGVYGELDSRHLGVFALRSSLLCAVFSNKNVRCSEHCVAGGLPQHRRRGPHDTKLKRQDWFSAALAGSYITAGVTLLHSHSSHQGVTQIISHHHMFRLHCITPASQSSA